MKMTKSNKTKKATHRNRQVEQKQTENEKRRV